MKLPKEAGSLPDIKSRAKRAFSIDSQWESMLSDAYEYFLPKRNLFDRNDVGQKKNDRIFDSTAPVAIQLGASKLQESIAPIWTKWATLDVSEELKRDIKEEGGELDESEIRENLETQTEIIFDYINLSLIHI